MFLTRNFEKLTRFFGAVLTGFSLQRDSLTMGKLPASALFDRHLIRSAADEPVFSRGLAYHEKGRARITSADGERITAVVSGTEDYRVELRLGGGTLSGMCNCRAREDSEVCKHMVAAALAANDLQGEKGDAPVQKKSMLAAFLEALPRERLIAIIEDHAARHPEIERALELAAMAGGRSGGEILDFFRRALKKAIKIRGFIEYRQAGAWARGVDEVLDAMTPLTQDGHGEAVLTLCEEALGLVNEASQNMDDSDGHAGGLLWTLREMHAKAAEAVKPEPRAFAARLLHLVSSLDFFEASQITGYYGEALGAEGLAELERLALEGLGKLPSKPRAAKIYVADEHSSDRTSLTQIAEDCAKLRGDVDAQLALKQRDLSAAYHYLGIVELLRKHGRAAEALKWAKDGMFVFEDDPDERLTLACVELLTEAGQRGAAEELLWKEFAATPSARLYSTLATRSNAAERRAVTDKAIMILEARLARSTPLSRHDYGVVPLLLAILTEEKRFAEAWESVARHGMTLNSANVEILADKSAELHPAEAVKVWKMKIEECVRMGGNQNYEIAHALVIRAGKLASGSGAKQVHAAFLADIFVRHKAKRNFIRLFS
jgi:uncharacterized Zn finger protein